MDSELVKVVTKTRVLLDYTKEEFDNLAQNIFLDLRHSIYKQPVWDDYRLVVFVINFMNFSDDQDCAKSTLSATCDEALSTTHTATATQVSTAPTMVRIILCVELININDYCFLAMDEIFRVS